MATVRLEDVIANAGDIGALLREAEEKLHEAWNLTAYDGRQGQMLEHPLDLPNPASRTVGFGIEMAREEICKALLGLDDVKEGREGGEPEQHYPGLG